MSNLAVDACRPAWSTTSMRLPVPAATSSHTSPRSNALANRTCKNFVLTLCTLTKPDQALACIRPKLDRVGRRCEHAISKIASPTAFLLH